MNSPPELNSTESCPPGLPATENNQEKQLENLRQCPICKVYYKNGNSYWQHVHYVHANFLSQCIICGKSYKRKTMTKQHVLHFHKIAWHLCSIYIKKIKKNDHQLQQIKLKEKSIEKKKESLKYFKKKTLQLISSFNCYDCPQAFSTINELFTHVKVHKNKQESDSEIESDAEDIHISENEINNVQNGLLKNIENIQNESVNEDEEIQDGEANEADDIQNASVIEIEHIQNESISEIEKVPNGPVNEFEAVQSLLTNDFALKIQ